MIKSLLKGQAALNFNKTAVGTYENKHAIKIYIYSFGLHSESGGLRSDSTRTPPDSAQTPADLVPEVESAQELFRGGV